MTAPDLFGDARPAPRPYRPPVGIPEKGERNRWRGLFGSLVLHLGIALVFLVPWVASEVLSVREKRAGMGMGERGGGGGGTRGTGGATTERLHYAPLVQPAPAAAPAAVPVPPPPVVPPPPPPQPTPQLAPPVPPPTPAPTPVPPPVTEAAAPAPVPAAVASGAATLGQGGGTGNDGTAGSGPGSGGGVGSGIGTGRGSGVGPGTGGGPDSIHPPTLLTLALPPLDAPPKVRPYKLVAYFDVDERGNTKLIGFNETSDGRFNRKVRDVLREVRFRPAVRLDGRPVRDTGRFEIEYP